MKKLKINLKFCQKLTNSLTISILRFRAIRLAGLLITFGVTHLAYAQLEDTTIPQLTGISVSHTQLDLSASSHTIQVTRSVTDDLSGIAYSGNGCTGVVSGLVFRSPSGTQTVNINNCSFTLSSGTKLDGEFIANAHFPRYAEQGIWTISSTYLEDQAGNSSTFGSIDFASLSIDATVEVTSAGDVTAPVPTAVSVSPGQIDLSQSWQNIAVTRSVTDDVSGVAYSGTSCTGFSSGLVFRSPSGAQKVKVHNCGFVLDSGTDLNGDFAASAHFPQYAEQGVWQLWSMIVEDQAGNFHNYGATELAGLGVTASVEVTSPGDSTPPQLSDVTIFPQLINTAESSQSVLVTRSVSDDFSGVAYSGTNCTGFSSGLVFRSPSGAQEVKIHNCGFMLDSGTDQNGDFTAMAHFPQFAESGIWPMVNMIIEDQAGNTQFLNASDFGALGINAFVEVAPAASDVDFLANGFLGTWTLTDANNIQVFHGSGDQTLMLGPGIYWIDIARTGLEFIEVELDGNVISDNPVAFTGGQRELGFNTSPVKVDPALYEGLWGVMNVAGYNTVADLGPQFITLVQGLTYNLRIANSSTAQFSIETSGVGDVTSLNPDAASTSGNTLTFNTNDLFIHPGFYPGSYAVWGVKGYDANTQPGTQSVKLLPNLNYDVRITGIAEAAFMIGFSASGQVSSHNLSAATGVGDTLFLNTTTITVDPGFYTGLWQVTGAFGSNGVDSIELPPGLSYKFFLTSQDSQLFSVSEPCAVSPSQINLAGETFRLSCGVPDQDDDGVPDAIDNCMLMPNPDQIDQDIDGVGNVCDDDLDGDGVDNALDNCPDLENVLQEDLDADGVGDDCDNDSDGDSVNNDIDNCPVLPNTDQANNDLDGLGDACDGDDDNDGVGDGPDNCQLDYNPGQEDFDMNGEGDICDGDIDGDGTSNSADLCELSPQSAIINDDGCTGSEFIALICVASDYVQHGKYVNCVAHAANGAVAEGLISPSEKARFVREAAKNR